jgi:SAM-dependent methyltransferase
VTYVHGYGDQESVRLEDQARALVDLLHRDTSYPPGSRVLEAGCGTGAQTVTLARNSPGASIVSIDVSPSSLDQARERVEEAGIANVELRQGDLFDPGFGPGSFDHVFVCFVLEHLSRPAEALTSLRSLLRPRGTITVIEGDHGSAYFHPDSAEAQAAIDALVTLQAAAGGDAGIGRQLYPLLAGAGFADVSVSPRMVYVDSSRPDLVQGFTRRTFTAMVEGVRDAAVGTGLIEPEAFDAGVEALHRTAGEDGVFCYTFFKGVGRAPECAGDLNP